MYPAVTMSENADVNMDLVMITCVSLSAIVSANVDVSVGVGSLG